MMIRCWLAVVLVLCIGIAHDARAEEAELWAWRCVLVTAGSFSGLGPAAPHLHDDKTYLTREIVDLAADVLVCQTPNGFTDDVARSHLVRLLARSKDPRYFNVLLRIANEREDSASRKSARQAVNKKKRPPVEQFAAGMSTLEQLRAEYQRAALAMEPTDESRERFRQLSNGTPLAQVFVTMGYPAQVTAHYLVVGTNKPYERLTLFYRKLGAVEIQLGHQGWVVKTLRPAVETS